jgi:hypothetical protein
MTYMNRLQELNDEINKQLIDHVPLVKGMVRIAISADMDEDLMYAVKNVNGWKPDAIFETLESKSLVLDYLLINNHATRN